MKNLTTKIIAAVFFIALVKNNSAQGLVDIYSVAPQMGALGSGLGGGLNILSAPLHVDTINPKHLNVQMGLGAFASSLNKSNPFTLPSLTNGLPGTNITLKNSLYAVNFITRFSLPLSKNFTPYADLFAGVRGISGSMDRSGTKQNVVSSTQFSYGMSAGITASVVKWMKVDAGFMLSCSGSPGQILDVNTAPKQESGQTTVNKINIPSSLFMFRLGMSFPITSRARKTPPPTTNKCSDCCQKQRTERDDDDGDDGDDD